MKSAILSNRELRIFKRQIGLPEIDVPGQEKLKKSKVLVVGAGGKGTFVLQNLAAAGVGFIGICDYHIVEETAISRQTLYSSRDLGKQKAIISKQKLTEQHPFCAFEIHNICLSETNIQPIISGYDIIVDATDSYTSHRIIDQAALKLNLPVVISMLHQGTIMVTVLHLNHGYSLQEIIHSDSHFQQDTLPTSGLAGEVIPYSLAGSLISNEVLKIILDFQGILNGKILKFNTASLQITIDSF
jgi:molybdopterin/thiamine biosynthesis adenylyltransferase